MTTNGRVAAHRGVTAFPTNTHGVRLGQDSNQPNASPEVAHLPERSVHNMGIGVSLFLLAVGAILTFAVHVSHSGGFDINTIGVILMVVGALGLVVSMIFWGSWNRRGDTVVREREVV
jgi:hypothetical protein